MFWRWKASPRLESSESSFSADSSPPVFNLSARAMIPQPPSLTSVSFFSHPRMMSWSRHYHVCPESSHRGAQITLASPGEPVTHAEPRPLPSPTEARAVAPGRPGETENTAHCPDFASSSPPTLRPLMCLNTCNFQTPKSSKQTSSTNVTAHSTTSQL